MEDTEVMQLSSNVPLSPRRLDPIFSPDFANENAVLSDDNTYLWNVLDVNSSI